MGEYDRQQRRQLSRAIANSGTGDGQLKKITDNRNHSLLQRAHIKLNYTTATGKSASVIGISGGVDLAPANERKMNEWNPKFCKYFKAKISPKKWPIFQCAEPHALTQVVAMTNIKKLKTVLNSASFETQAHDEKGFKSPCSTCAQWVVDAEKNLPINPTFIEGFSP